MKLKRNTIYLASKSPRRREILKKYGIAFKVVSSLYEELDMPHKRPHSLVTEHAMGKALQAQTLPQNARWVLGVDTIVYFNGKVLGKPKNLKDAERMLNSLQGNDHVVYSGVALRDAQKDQIFKMYEKTTVRMKSLSLIEIRKYFKGMNPLDKAGSYAIQSKVSVVDKIIGSYTNVMGLPMEKLQSWADEI